MKEEIKKFQNHNGNITYTTKELIQALHTKFDEHAKYNHESHGEIRNRLAAGEGRFGTIEGQIKTSGLFFKIIPPAFITMMGSLLWLVLHLHNIL